MHDRLELSYTSELRKRVGNTWASLIGCQDGSGNDTGVVVCPTDAVNEEKYVRIVSRYIKDKDAHILDVGAGDGAETKNFINAGFINTFGLTIGGENTAIAKEKHHINLYFMDMHFTMFANGIFDAVVGFHTFEHSPSPILLLLEFNRILKRGGKVIMLIPGGERSMPYEQNPHHCNVLEPWQGRNIIRKCGFINVTAESMGEEILFYGEKGDIEDVDTCFRDIVNGKFC